MAQSVTAWLQCEHPPPNLYRLLGRQPLDPDLGGLKAAVSAAARELLPYQNHADPTKARRAMALLLELGRVENLLSDPQRLVQLKRQLFGELAAKCRDQFGADAANWQNDALTSWLRSTGDIHPAALDETVHAILEQAGAPPGSSAKAVRVFAKPGANADEQQIEPEVLPDYADWSDLSPLDDLLSSPAADSAADGAPPVDLGTSTPKPAELLDTSTTCPECKAPLIAGAVLCVACGYDMRTGRRLTARIGNHSADSQATEAAKPRTGAARKSRLYPSASAEKAPTVELMRQLAWGGGALVAVSLTVAAWFLASSVGSDEAEYVVRLQPADAVLSSEDAGVAIHGAGSQRTLHVAEASQKLPIKLVAARKGYASEERLLAFNTLDSSQPIEIILKPIAESGAPPPIAASIPPAEESGASPLDEAPRASANAEPSATALKGQTATSVPPKPENISTQRPVSGESAFETALREAQSAPLDEAPASFEQLLAQAPTEPARQRVRQALARRLADLPGSIPGDQVERWLSLCRRMTESIPAAPQRQGMIGQYLNLLFAKSALEQLLPGYRIWRDEQGADQAADEIGNLLAQECINRARTLPATQRAAAYDAALELAAGNEALRLQTCRAMISDASVAAALPSEKVWELYELAIRNSPLSTQRDALIRALIAEIRRRNATAETIARYQDQAAANGDDALAAQILDVLAQEQLEEALSRPAAARQSAVNAALALLAGDAARMNAYQQLLADAAYRGKAAEAELEKMYEFVASQPRAESEVSQLAQYLVEEFVRRRKIAAVIKRYESLWKKDESNVAAIGFLAEAYAWRAEDNTKNEQRAANDLAASEAMRQRLAQPGLRLPKTGGRRGAGKRDPMGPGEAMPAEPFFPGAFPGFDQPMAPGGMDALETDDPQGRRSKRRKKS